MIKTGIWAIIVVTAFIAGTIAANPSADAAGGWKEALEALTVDWNQLTGVPADIADGDDVVVQRLDRIVRSTGLHGVEIIPGFIELSCELPTDTAIGVQKADGTSTRLVFGSFIHPVGESWNLWCLQLNIIPQ